MQVLGPFRNSDYLSNMDQKYQSRVYQGKVNFKA